MKIVVVGGGVLGASAAYHLARAGAETVLVEQGHEGRATSAGAGIVCPWASENEDPAWYRLAAGAGRYYPNLVAALAEDGETEIGYRRVGALVVQRDAAPLDRVEARTRARAADAPEAGVISRLSAVEARAAFPPLHEAFAAVHIAGGARVDGKLLAAAMVRAARRHGASLHTGAAGLQVSGGRVRGVSVDGVDIGADAVIVCGGAWAPALLAPFGVELRVSPQRGQIIHLHLPGVATRDLPIVQPMNGHYLLAFDDARVVVGATRETGSGFDYRMTAGGVAEVLTQALAVAPGLAGATLHEIRIGFRPMSFDGLPLLGWCRGVEGLMLGNGLGPSGLTQGPFAGKLLAALALEQKVEIDLAAYDPERPTL